MSYCTLSDLETRIGETRLLQLADRDGDGSADSAVVDAAIARAQATIDAHLRPRYRVPFDPTPGLVREIAIDLALFALREGRRESIDDRDRDAYRETLRFLQAAGRGEAGVDFGDAADSVEERAVPEFVAPRAGDERVYLESLDSTGGLDGY